jgi:hypothetical protein
MVISKEVRIEIEKTFALLGEIADRLEELAAGIEAPSLEELQAIEAGDRPMTPEAALISVLTEQSLVVGEAADALRGSRYMTERLFEKSWFPGFRLPAKTLAHLRAGLRGRTLPADFMPPERLGRMTWEPPMGSALVADLLAQGYVWEYSVPRPR